jgi:hypothetical protein
MNVGPGIFLIRGLRPGPLTRSLARLASSEVRPGKSRSVRVGRSLSLARCRRGLRPRDPSLAHSFDSAPVKPA